MAAGETLARIRLALEGQPAVVSGMKEVERQFDSIKQAFAGLAGGLTIAGFAAFIKSGIDAADAMDELSERTGLAVKDIAGLQIAYKLAGMEGDALEKSMGRMNKAIVEGNKAFDAMGVKTKNADGTFRGVRDILGDVADKFASYEDGAAKSALAQELFGKSGAEMLGVLNQGKAGLDEFDETARRLGLTMSDEAAKDAAKFNDTLDLLGMGTQGIARQIAAGLVPTLATMAGEMLGSATDTGTLAAATTILGGTLKTLYTIAAAGIGVFRVLGKGVGAVAAAFFEVTRGNFSGAWEALKAGSEDIDSVVASTIASVGRVWNDVGSAGVIAMAGVQAAARKAAPVVGDVAKEAKKSKDEFAALLDKINGKHLGVDADYAKNLKELYEGYQAGRIGLDAYIVTIQRYIGQQQFAKEAAAAANKEWDEYFEKLEQARLKNDGQIKSAREMLESIQFETAALKMTNQERQIAIAMRDLERQGIVKGTQAYEEFAEKIKSAIVTREQTQEAIDAQQEQLEGWKSIDKTAHDVFVNVFEDGAGTFKRLTQTLKATLLDLLYQMTVKRWIIQIGASLTGLSVDVVSRALGGGSGGSGVLGLASNGLSASNLLSNSAFGSALFGNSFAYGAAVPGLTVGSPQAMMLAEQTGVFGLQGLQATAAAGQTAPGAMGAGWAALPFALAAIGWFGSDYFDKGDTFSGAAYATSSGDERTTGVVDGSLNPNVNTGDRPDREALIQWLVSKGAKRDQLEGLNDRQLHRLMLLAENEIGMERDGGPMMNWSGWADANKDLPDFYKGQGYAFPEDLGWWEVQDQGSNDRYRSMDSFFVDPKVVEMSRQISLGILEPLDKLTEQIGKEAEFRVTTGMAYNDKTGKIFGGLSIQRDGESLVNWGKREFENQDEYFRALYHDSIGAVGDIGLPEWADKQVKDAQKAISELEGEKIGERAATIYSEATAYISNTYAAIEGLIKIIPDLAGVSQETVYDLGELFGGVKNGGLNNYASAYAGYVQNYYTDDERKNYVRRGINDSLAAANVSIDGITTREQYRQLIEAQDLTTESGRAAYAALIKAAGAFAEITPLVDELTEKIQGFASQIGSDFTSVMTDGLLGNLTGEDPGGQMAEVVIGGVYSALAGNTAQQISSMLTENIVKPLLRAALTGSSISEAVSQASIEAMVANAKIAIEALGKVFSNPEFKEAMRTIDAGLNDLFGALPTVPYYGTYKAIQKDTQTQAERTNAAVKDAYATIRDYLRSLETDINASTSPESRLRESQAEYLRLLGLARSGDSEAISQITKAAQDYLKAGEAYYASGSMQQAIMAQVKDELGKLSGYKPNITSGIAPPNYSSFASSNNVAPLLAEIQAMRAEIAALNEELHRNTSVTAAGAQANVDATNAGTSATNNNGRYAALLT